jgi:hypothetical protein
MNEEIKPTKKVNYKKLIVFTTILIITFPIVLYGFLYLNLFVMILGASFNSDCNNAMPNATVCYIGDSLWKNW